MAPLYAKALHDGQIFSPHNLSASETVNSVRIQTAPTSSPTAPRHFDVGLILQQELSALIRRRGNDQLNVQPFGLQVAGTERHPQAQELDILAFRHADPDRGWRCRASACDGKGHDRGE
jgi:hypothetical protein